MAAGDLTMSAATVCSTATEIKTAVDALNLAATTDFVFVIPINGRPDKYYVFKVERAAA